MLEKIGRFLREYVFILSIVTIIIGFFLLITGVLGIWFSEVVKENNFLQFIDKFGPWNAYIFVIGIIILFIGIYYLYSFQKNKRFILKEIKTNKRSEFIKMHRELKNVVKHLPSKYRKMLRDKEKELKIR
jgi:hypothetical protein